MGLGGGRAGNPVSSCIFCKRPVTAEEHMVDGEPAVCSWTPPGAGKSVYAIVTAHLRCMGVPQLQQALACWQDEAKQRGWMSQIQIVVEKRLSELLAGGRRDDSPSPPTGSRFENLELD